MASLDILRSKPFNLKNKITRTLENTLWPIKNFEKYLMFHQYMPKIFHDTNKNSQPTPPPPPTPTHPPSHILNVRSLRNRYIFAVLFKANQTEILW